MFLYIFVGFSLLFGGIYLFNPGLFYKGIINISLIVIKNMLWLKQIKRNYLEEVNQLVHNNELEIDDIKVHEFVYKTTNLENNYSYNYVLKYIENKDKNKNEVNKNIKNKLKNLENIDILDEKINKILYCSFYSEEDVEKVIDLTKDLRYFILHFECEETTIYKFLKYANENYNLNMDTYDSDKCGLCVIKNDDTFSEIKISLNDSKFVSFKEVFKCKK